MRRRNTNQAVCKTGLDALLDRRRLDELARHTDALTVPSGTVLARAGRFPRQFVIVMDGSVDVTDGSGHTHVAGPGIHIGGPELLHRQPHAATCIARSECLIVVIHGRALVATFDHPDVVSWVERHSAVRQGAAAATNPAVRDLALAG